MLFAVLDTLKKKERECMNYSVLCISFGMIFSYSFLSAFIIYNDSPCLILDVQKRSASGQQSIEIPPLQLKVIPETKENCASDFVLKVRANTSKTSEKK